MPTWIIVVVSTALLFTLMGLFVKAASSSGCAGRLDHDDASRCRACPQRDGADDDSADFGACPGLPEK